jgi:hypothetical protein
LLYQFRLYRNDLTAKAQRTRRKRREINNSDADGFDIIGWLSNYLVSVCIDIVQIFKQLTVNSQQSTLSMNFALNFKPSQIVSLEYGNTCLHSEVIQVVEARQICWVRPLMLVVFQSGDDLADRLSEDYTISDLRNGADLLWPLSLFRAALDTEVISLLSQLYSLDSEKKDAVIASRQLRDFVDRVWTAFPTAFN